MKQYALLRLLFALFLLYIAWPSMIQPASGVAQLFWSMWFVFVLVVSGANLATLMELNRTVQLEQSNTRRRQVDNH